MQNKFNLRATTTDKQLLKNARTLLFTVWSERPANQNVNLARFWAKNAREAHFNLKLPNAKWRKNKGVQTKGANSVQSRKNKIYVFFSKADSVTITKNQIVFSGKIGQQMFLSCTIKRNVSTALKIFLMQPGREGFTGHLARLD